MTHAAIIAEELEKKENSNGSPSTAIAIKDANTDLTVETDDSDEGQPLFKGINVSASTLTQATKDLPESQRVPIRWLYHHARSEGMSFPDVVQLVGASRSLLQRAFTGKHFYPQQINIRNAAGEVIGKKPHPKAGQPIPLDFICKKIRKAKLDLEKRESVFSVGFLKTTVWDRINFACTRAMEMNRIEFIYGETQFGKTVCAKEFCRQHNGGQSAYVRIPPNGGVQSLVQAIAKARNLPTNRPYRELRKMIIDALDKSNFVFFDEIHQIFLTYTKTSVMKCMEEIRWIYDETHAGMAVSGTRVFSRAVHEGEFVALLKQMLKRGSLEEVQIPEIVPKSDVVMALESYGLAWPKDPVLVDELRHLVREGLGTIMTKLENGKRMAEKSGEAYDWPHYTKARDILRKLGLNEIPKEEKI